MTVDKCPDDVGWYVPASQVAHSHMLSGGPDPRTFSRYPRSKASRTWFRPLLERVTNEAPVGSVAGSSLAEWIEKRIESSRQPLLDFDVAHGTSPIALLEIVDLLRVRVECIVIHEDWVAFDVPGIGRPEPRRICVHRTHFLAHDGWRMLEIDCVVARLAHLRLPVSSNEPWHAAH